MTRRAWAQTTDSWDRVGATVSFLRIVYGWALFTEGAGKLWGWFGGPGIKATRALYDSLGVPFSPWHAHLVGAVELAAGFMLVAGLLTRIAIVPVLGMIIAMTWLVMSWVGEIQLRQLFTFAAALLLLQLGSGPISLDQLLSHRKSGK